jgi:hypothetical protein
MMVLQLLPQQSHQHQRRWVPMRAQLLILAVIVLLPMVHSFTISTSYAVNGMDRLRTLTTSISTTIPSGRNIGCRNAVKVDSDHNDNNKNPKEVVEEYRDNLSNSRTAKGHHDGKEKKVGWLIVRSFLLISLFIYLYVRMEICVSNIFYLY